MHVAPPAFLTVQVFRSIAHAAQGTPSAMPAGTVQVQLGAKSVTSDAAKGLVKNAVAQHASVAPRDVLVNRTGTGFVAYLPSIAAPAGATVVHPSAVRAPPAPIPRRPRK
jgi:hypothetical protein